VNWVTGDNEVEVCVAGSYSIDMQDLVLVHNATCLGCLYPVASTRCRSVVTAWCHAPQATDQCMWKWWKHATVYNNQLVMHTHQQVITRTTCAISSTQRIHIYQRKQWQNIENKFCLQKTATNICNTNKVKRYNYDDKHSIICKNEKNSHKIISQDTQAYSARIEKLIPYTLKHLIAPYATLYKDTLIVISEFLPLSTPMSAVTGRLLLTFSAGLHFALSLKSDSLPSLTLL